VRRSTLDAGLIRAIAREVEHAGGDYHDARDLMASWERVQRRNSERASVIRREVAELPAPPERETESPWRPPARPRRPARRFDSWALL